MKKMMITLLITALAGLSYTNGQVKDKISKDGEFTAITRYYDDGTVKETGKYLNGKPEGNWTEYYANGNVKTEAYFVKGKKSGTWLVYSEDGETLYELVYENNKLAETHQWKIKERDVLAKN